MTYAEKLKSPKWQKRRLQILERDNFTCTLCADSETTLHVHHLRYFKNRNPWEYEDGDLMTLCEDCHEFYERHKKDLGEPEYFHAQKFFIDNEPVLAVITNKGLFFSKEISSFSLGAAKVLEDLLRESRKFREQKLVTQK